jgi:hypothetical protein
MYLNNMAPMNPLPLVSMDVSHFYTYILKDAGIVACRGLGTVTSEISALRMHSVTTNSRPIEEVHS